MRVRVTGIKQYKDRHGRLRRYYRRKGAPGIPISPDLSGSELIAEIARLDAKYKPLTPLAGTLRILVSKYMTEADHWRNLRVRTRADYERVYNWLGDAMDHPLIAFTTPAIAGLRDKARKQHGFKFANQTVITLKMVFNFAVETGDMDSNPATAVSKIQRPKDLPTANRPWSADEAVHVLKSLPVHLRAPVAVSLYLGVREGDIVKLPRQKLSERLLTLTTSKDAPIHGTPTV